MARVIATGAAPAGRAARIGGAFGQGLNAGVLAEIERMRQEEQMREAADPVRSALTSILQQQGALGPGGLEQVAGSAMRNPIAFALQGGGGQGTTPPARMPAQPETPPAAPQPTGQGTQAQQLLARIQQDPQAFARLFADQGVEGVLSMASPGGRAAPVRGQPGDVFFDPTTGERVFEVPAEPGKPYSDIGELRADFQAGKISREDFQQARSALLASDEPVVAVADPESSTGLRFVPRSEAAGREAPVSTGVTINNVGPDEFEKANAKTVNEALTGIITQGGEAGALIPNLERAGQLLVSDQVQTGRGQALLLPLQQIADDFGLNLNRVAEGIGVDPQSLANKEEFDRLTTELIINGFSKFKGNLNQKEVELAQNAFANFGRSEEANLEAIAAMLAGAEIAVQRRQRALTEATDLESARGLLADLSSTDASEFERLRKANLQQLQSLRTPQGGGERAQPGGQEAPQISREAAQQTLPEGFNLGEQLSDGRWTVVDSEGNIVGHVEP